ncbi:MAG TPA: ATP-binding protein [Gemmatimonadaceae bacterium]|nr:ATP-binding protein [Gemmatimonadaceae bacterium]
MSGVVTGWRRLPIAIKVPVSLGVLLTVVLVGMSVGAWIAVRRSALAAAEDRLEQVSQQFTAMLVGNWRERLAATQGVAANPALADWLASSHPAARDEALDSLRAYAVRAGSQLAAVELWSAGGDRLAFAGEERPPYSRAEASKQIAVLAPQGRSAFGLLVESRGQVEYSVISAVLRNDRPVGYVVERRYLSTTPAALQRIKGLIGEETHILIGNRSGDVWSDFRGPVAPPPVAPGDSAMTRQYHRGGSDVVGRLQPMPPTPWTLGLEFPAASVFAGATGFLARSLFLSAILAVAGAAAGSVLSRRVTSTIARVTASAEAMAAGRPSEVVEARRSDEIGRLATSFNAMAAEVGRGRERLETLVQRYRLLFDENPLPMFVFEPESLAILDVNDAAVRNYGYSREEFVAMTMRDIRPPEDVRKIVDHFRNAQLGLAAAGMARHLRKDGSTIDVEVTRHLMEIGGRRIVLSLANDVTARLAAERARGESEAELRRLNSELEARMQELRHSQQQLLHMQKMDALGRLAGGVAHDFNNVTTAILGFTGFVLESLPQEDERRRDLEEIRGAAERAAGLTRQLLAFSRRQMIDVRPLRVNEAVAKMERLLQRLIGENVELVTRLCPEAGWIHSDAGQLEQVIVNLAVNARDAMPRGGKLTIETARAVLDASYVASHPEASVGPHVWIAVSDTGVGMDAATRARLFEPFFTTKERGQGTGLGLATVYGIVRQAGGHIEVRSEPGRGSTFRILIPEMAAPGGDWTAPATTDSAVLTGTETILLAEDDEVVRRVATRILSSQGYRVLAASSGTQAIALIEADPERDVHLLLTDVVMPEMSGPELAAKLAARLPRLRVIFMSGYTGHTVERDGALPRNAVYLQKPFTMHGIAQTVREVLDRT